MEGQMAGALARRYIIVAILSLFGVCIGRPCLAALSNGACAAKPGYLGTSVGSSPATGTERILRVPTFAFIASFDDFTKLDEYRRQIFVDSGTRYFQYDNDKDYQKVPGYKLVLLENGICTYLTNDDVNRWSGVREQYKKPIGTISSDRAAFFNEPYGPYECNGTRVWITPGVVYDVEASDKYDQIMIKYSGKGLSCDLSIPKGSTKIVDFNEIIEWEKRNAFRPVIFSNFRGIRKECWREYQNSDETKMGIGAGIKATKGPISADGEFKISRDTKEAFSLGNDIDYLEQPYTSVDDQSFYWTAITQCPPIATGGQGRAQSPPQGLVNSTYQFSMVGKQPLTWSTRTANQKAKLIRDRAESINIAQETGRPIVTCPAQQFANLELLQHLGWTNEDDARFVLAQIGQWIGPPQSRGLQCYREPGERAVRAAW
jgi:hypothetical protein